MSINWQEIVFNFLGGLGLFLYSIKTMGEGLQQAAGDRLRYYIDKYTSNPFLGVLVGIDSVEFRGYSDYGRSGECRTSNPPSSYWYCYGGQYWNDYYLLYHWF